MVARTRDAMEPAPSERVLLLSPTGRDAVMLSGQLRQHGLEVEVCADVESLCSQIERGAGAIFVAEESLRGAGIRCLYDILKGQPAWSDVPVIVMTRAGGPFDALRLEKLRDLGNVTLLERPIRLVTLFSVIDSALRSRRRQYQVQRLLEEFQHGVEQRDRFLAMLGHELRNPLAAIVSAISILRNFGGTDSDLSDEQHEVIARQSSHMARLVDDLLDVARITAGKIALNLKPVDLRDVVQRGMQALNATRRDNGHEIRLELPEDPVVVSGDAVRLEQVVVNLLVNAVKYTPAGGKICLRISVDDAAVLSVRDTGEGIPASMIERIFEPFTQAEQSLERSRGGLGMGLTVVKSVVEMHGGQVTVASDGPGLGTEFVVRLPPVRQLPVEVPPEDFSPAVNPCQVLLVEDNSDSRRTLSRLLRLLGHNVETAEDGPAGLRKALEIRPEVVLLDIGLPGMDGYEVACNIRAALRDEVYLIAVTGYGQIEDRERVRQAGFDLHLIKPVDPDQLNKVLAERACGKPMEVSASD